MWKCENNVGPTVRHSTTWVRETPKSINNTLVYEPPYVIKFDGLSSLFQIIIVILKKNKNKTKSKGMALGGGRIAQRNEGMGSRHAKNA